MDLARAPRRARSNARKKGSGYENEAKLEGQSQSFHASRFGFMKKMGSLSEGSVPAIFVSMNSSSISAILASLFELRFSLQIIYGARCITAH